MTLSSSYHVYDFALIDDFETQTGTFPDVLQYVGMPTILSNAECTNRYQDIFDNYPEDYTGPRPTSFNSPSFLCAENPNEAEFPCLGDLGGPLVCMSDDIGDNRALIVGIILGGQLACSNSEYVNTYPPLFSRVTTPLGWIQSNMV